MSRDKVSVNSQFKRPSVAGSRETAGEAQVGREGGDSGGKRKLATSDALKYIMDVKDMLHDRMDKYDEFLEILKDFKAHRIDVIDVAAKVKELFEEHPQLIPGFNVFLPEGREISLSSEDGKPPVKKIEFKDATAFVNKIKARFQGVNHTCEALQDLLKMYRKDIKSTAEVYRKAAKLFKDHDDLIDEFNRFLASEDEKPLPAVEFKEAMAFVNKVKIRFQGDDRIYKAFLDLLTKYRKKNISHTEVYQELAKLFKYHDDLLDEFTRFLPSEDEKPQPAVEFKEAMAFVNKVKIRFQWDDRIYKAFLDLLTKYRKKNISHTEVYQELAKLFKDHDDLLDEFTRFLPSGFVSSALE